MNLEQALQQYFGFPSFRPNQRDVIESLLAGQPTLAVLPTGLGKSLCYQLTAQLLPGVTLVISPLIALMQDQVEALQRRGFDNVTYLSSALTPAQVGARFDEIERGAHKLIYIAPERCDSPRFQRFVQTANISLVVIDEAHCISQWGHDFRPHYRNLLTRLPELKRANFLALTATATPEVQNDIVSALSLPNIKRIIADFNRPNLYFESIAAATREEKEAWLLKTLTEQDLGGSTIVYCSTRKEAKMTFDYLQARGFNVELYHAGLSAEARTKAQRQFINDEVPLIVATVAFGMGIDKPDVRRVIHFNIPGTLEGYYQEAGRAGRDGEAAICSLLYAQPDLRTQRFLIEQAYPHPQVIERLMKTIKDAHPLPVSAGDLTTATGVAELSTNAALQLLYEQGWVAISSDGKYALAQPAAKRYTVDFRPLGERRKHAEARFQRMIEFAAADVCRREVVLQYFGQHFAAPCFACDVCTAATTVISTPPQFQATAESDRVARIILQAADDFGGRIGRSLIADVLGGSKAKRITERNLNRARCYGALSLHANDQVRDWIDELIAQKLLRVTAEEYPGLLLTDAGIQAFGAPGWIALSGFATPKEKNKPTATEAASLPEGNEAIAPALNAKLREWRRAKANEIAMPPYIVLHNTVLDEIAARQPNSLDELRTIKGIGETKIESFGAEIITLVQSVAGEAETMNTPAAASSAASLDWRLQIELWEQGGAEPERQALLAALENHAALERGELIVLLGVVKELKLREAANILLQMLAGTTDGNFLTALCLAVGALGLTSATPSLLLLLDDTRPGIRRAAVRALGQMRVTAALPKLERLAEIESSEVVKLSLRAALWRIKGN
jgi:ATP-dependent DNA helicase RecQ